MTYGGGTYGGSSAPDPPEEGAGDLTAEVALTGFGAIRYVVPPRANLTATGDLTSAEPSQNRSGGSTASVLVTPEGLGTKFLIGTTARVLVNPTGQGARVPPYTEHPNARRGGNLVPRTNVALATFPRDEAQEPAPTDGRQLVLLGAAPGSGAESPEDDSIFDIDHR